MKLFYKADKARCSDIIPFYDHGCFKPFYLKRWPPNYAGIDAKPGWYMLETNDFVHFKEHDTGISGATGSVIFTNGMYHMFFCRLLPESQTIRHAVSKDLDTWQEVPGDVFVPDGKIYSMTDWRDPFVFYNEEEKCWWMLACASLNHAPTKRRGCIALCVSEDLSHWTYREPFYAPGTHQSALECPDLFKIGDWYYLIYSAVSSRFNTFYRMSRRINGPWIAPENDTFDARTWYAGKTASDGVNRYIFAWTAAKEFNSKGFNPTGYPGKDYGTYDHGGTMVVHQLKQEPDGTLTVHAPLSVMEAVSKPLTVSLQPLQGEWNIADNRWTCDSPYGYGCAVLNTLPEVCRIHMEVVYNDLTMAFGPVLQVDEDFVRGYYLELEPARQRIQWKSPIRMDEDGGFTFPYEVEMERPVSLHPGQTVCIDILMENDLIVTYINQKIALTTRAFDYKARKLGIFVTHGRASFSNVSMYTL